MFHYEMKIIFGQKLASDIGILDFITRFKKPSWLCDHCCCNFTKILEYIWLLIRAALRVIFQLIRVAIVCIHFCISWSIHQIYFQKSTDQIDADNGLSKNSSSNTKTQLTVRKLWMHCKSFSALLRITWFLQHILQRNPPHLDVGHLVSKPLWHEKPMGNTGALCHVVSTLDNFDGLSRWLAEFDLQSYSSDSYMSALDWLYAPGSAHSWF